MGPLDGLVLAIWPPADSGFIGTVVAWKKLKRWAALECGDTLCKAI